MRTFISKAEERHYNFMMAEKKAEAEQKPPTEAQKQSLCQEKTVNERVEETEVAQGMTGIPKSS